MRPKFILFGEGQGETESGALVAMARKFFDEKEAVPKVELDRNCFRIGEYRKFLKKDRDNRTNIHRHLSAALKRQNVGAIIVVLDGDVLAKGDFCPPRAAKEIMQEAEKVGAGKIFSFAVCFAMQEYESWFIAAAKNKSPLPTGYLLPEEFPQNPDLKPTAAKGWISRNLFSNYNPRSHQTQLTESFSLEDFRNGDSKSFDHFDRMMQHLIEDCKSGNRAIHPQRSAQA